MSSPPVAFVASAPLLSRPQRRSPLGLRSSSLIVPPPPWLAPNRSHGKRRHAHNSNHSHGRSSHDNVTTTRATASDSINPPISSSSPSSSPQTVDMATTTTNTTSSSGATSTTPPEAQHIIHLYRKHDDVTVATTRALSAVFGDAAQQMIVEQETCFNIGLSAPLTSKMRSALDWLLAETWQPTMLQAESHFSSSSQKSEAVVLEVGPRLNFQTAWSSNAVSICSACAIPHVTRLERSRRYRITDASLSSCTILTPEKVAQLTARLHDRMTETVYKTQLNSFTLTTAAAKSYDIDVLGQGRAALRKASDDNGLGFDDQDIEYYHHLFVNDMQRNPTNVELFDLAQSNSEHSRHWFFKGNLIVDDVATDKHLFDMVRDTLTALKNSTTSAAGDGAEQSKDNSVIAFADNSSSIRGKVVDTLVPMVPGMASPLRVQPCDRDIVFTAETHNFPSGVAPFPGAETGTGGRIRDTAATGTGSLVGTASAGYAVGHLHIPDCPQPWEQDAAFQYPSNLASPLDILLLASDGASDYGNKFGEPVINGFARTYGLRTPTSSAQQAPDDDNNNDDSKYWGSQRREYVKPIMFSSGMGQMEHTHATKGEPSVGLLVVKVGGPAYRIGMGGGAASSMMQGDNRDDLDFNAVQRGDAQMAQRVYRVLRACVELGPHNPIVSIHDQGAGGNCNVVKELIFPAGATIDVRSVVVGDASLSALEIWGAEYQEQFGLLLHPEREPLFNDMCRRENVTPAVLGTIDGSGRIRLWDSVEQRNVVDLDLKAVLGDLPRKTFVDRRLRLRPRPRQDAVGSSSTTLALPPGTSIVDMLHRVVALMTVGSKRFLTTKVDRSVTGLVAQQQCVGPLLLPLCGYAVTAQSHMALAGSATAIGECPSLTSVNPAAMARMAVAEMLTNLCGAAVTARVHIKCEANWMWAAKLPGDCASLLDAVASMRDVMISLGLAVDGGKDSLSMAARCPAGVTDEDDALQQDEEVVRAPGTLVVSGYCTMKDIRRKLTPDLKRAGGSSVVLVDIAQGRRRLAGSALAYVYGQLGGEYHDEGDNSSSDCPDVDNPTVLAAAFDHVQSLIAQQKPVRTGTSGVLAYHDVSVGGLLVALLEMAFAGNVGLNVAVHSQQLNSSSSNPGDTVATLFAEEVGMLLEVSDDALDSVLDGFRTCQVPCHIVATTRSDHVLHVKDNGVDVLLQADSSDGNTTSTTSSGENYSDIRYWRDKWEATSFALEMQQAAPQCVRAERDGLFSRTGPVYQVPWTPTPVTPCRLQQQKDVDSDVVPFRPCVAIVREEGSNGDREMSAAFHLAGFAVWDVAMRDIAAGHIKLSAFSGIAFVGGFSFGDVLDSAKGWAGVAQLSDVVRAELDAFFKREDTFSLGVCNGCQLMTLMSRVPSFLHEDSDAAAMENMRKKQPRFVRNKSGRYESRFSTVVVAHDSPAVMLKGMGGAKLGVWVAHGEGRAFFPDDAVKQAVLDQRLAPIRYVDDAGEVTESYPHNPNGSDEGVAALCSRDGRHLAMMPHPERSVQLWQWPYATDEATRAGVSPWLTMFQNAYDWAVDAHVQQQQQQQQQ